MCDYHQAPSTVMECSLLRTCLTTQQSPEIQVTACFLGVLGRISNTSLKKHPLSAGPRLYCSGFRLSGQRRIRLRLPHRHLRSMGDKDVTGALVAVECLMAEHGVERQRIGIYSLSNGEFFTLMSLFKHPSVFAAGVANAVVTDWAHYNHLWTSRVLNLPHQDPDAYRKSSPIYFALQDHLLIVHGLIDDNVHFQDAARLVQRLIELEKSFE